MKIKNIIYIGLLVLALALGTATVASNDNASSNGTVQIAGDNDPGRGGGG